MKLASDLRLDLGPAIKERMMIKEWPECPYCGKALESDMLYTELGPRLVLFCICEAFDDIEEQLTKDIEDSFGDD